MMFARVRERSWQCVQYPSKPSGRADILLSGFDFVGAGDGDRTHDIQLGKLAFYR
jgi:hypothetical protein